MDFVNAVKHVRDAWHIQRLPLRYVIWGLRAEMVAGKLHYGFFCRTEDGVVCKEPAADFLDRWTATKPAPAAQALGL
jgi:hypothetical protein